MHDPQLAGFVSPIFCSNVGYYDHAFAIGKGVDPPSSSYYTPYAGRIVVPANAKKNESSFGLQPGSKPSKRAFVWGSLLFTLAVVLASTPLAFTLPAFTVLVRILVT